MKKSITLLFLLFVAGLVHGQNKDKLFGNGERKARKGFILNGNVGADLPAGDMAKRFGYSYRLGPAVLYKTLDNW